MFQEMKFCYVTRLIRLNFLNLQFLLKMIFYYMINLNMIEIKMKEYLNFYPPAMSKGTLQRMLLMFTFLRKSPNFLLDEPFNGLDPIQLKQSLELCKGLKDEKCILISSHDIESLEEICDVFLIFTKEEIKEITGSIDRVRVNKMIGDSYD